MFIVMQLVGGCLAAAAIRILYPHIADSAGDVIVPHSSDAPGNGSDLGRQHVDVRP